MELNQVKREFIDYYGNSCNLLSFHSPGRVNLIGEHTDYNGGCVLPCALSFGTYAVVNKRSDAILNFASTNYDLWVKCDLRQLSYDPKDGWANYLKGVAVEFQKLGFELGGLDILISGNIPSGAGLSSSASIELLMSVILNECFGCGLETREMIMLSQRAENRFVGVNCGIMDQYAIGMGKKGHAVFLDCKTISHAYIPLDLKDYRIVIANTNKLRELADSKYNERRTECEKAVEYLNKELSIQHLVDISAEEWEAYSRLIPDETVLRRGAHVVYENKRVKEAVANLKAGNLDAFGALMTQTHYSLRDLYEVSCLELDTLVAEALRIDGVAGSRMTGAGFGGCTVSIVNKDAVQEFCNGVGKRYREITGLTADFYIAETGDGAKRIE